MNETRETVADMFQAAIGPDHADEAVASHIRGALYDLVSALAWADDNPNRAEYYATLADLHRDDPTPHLAAIVTAASWLKGAA